MGSLSIAAVLSSSGVLSILGAAGDVVHVTHRNRSPHGRKVHRSVLRLYDCLCIKRPNAIACRTVYSGVECEAELRFDVQRLSWQERKVKRGNDVVDQLSTDVSRRLLRPAYLGTSPIWNSVIHDQGLDASSQREERKDLPSAVLSAALDCSPSMYVYRSSAYRWQEGWESPRRRALALQSSRVHHPPVLP